MPPNQSPDQREKEMTVSDIRGVERLEPQITLQCVDCEQRPGEEEMGGYFTYPAADVEKAIEEADYHVIDGSLVCDNCAYEREHRNAA